MNLKETTLIIFILFFLPVGGAFSDTAPEIPYAVNTNLSRSGWDDQGWRIVKRSPSNYIWDSGTADEANDFTVFQAEDETWQIIGCVRNTTFPGYTRLLFQWETDDFFSTDWTEVGVLLTTDDGPPGIDYGEGRLQAPHVVKDGDLYYMIYNSDHAHLMVSTNGKDWEHQAASDGGYILFEINQGRDIALVDNRDVDGKWYAFYCGKSNWVSTGNTNYYHSAANIIGPWSDATPMATRDHWRDVESPFIVRRGGWYYLFLQDQVRAEPCITNFFSLPVHTDLGTYSESPRWGYAPEVIHHPNGQDYLASYNDADGKAWEGTEIRPLYWEYSDVVVVDKPSLSVLEGSNTTFNVRLPREPSGTVEVVVGRFSGDTNISVSPTNLTFTTVTWSNWQPVVVSAGEDDNSTSDRAVIVCSTPEFDSRYVDITEIDNDFPGIIVSSSAVGVPEGGTAGFDIKLTGDPGGSWTVTTARVSGDSNITVFAGDSLVFDSGRWDIYRPVTLAAADDDDLVSGVATIRCSAVSMEDVDIIATEVEDDELNMLLSTHSLMMVEKLTATFGIKLNGDPITPRTVTVSRISGDSNITVSAESPLVLHSGNWNDYLLVTLFAFADEDDQNGEAIIQCVSSGMNSTNITVVEIDIDDFTPPQLSSAQALSGYIVQVRFSEGMGRATVENISNYAVNNGVAVKAAARDANDHSIIRLYVSDLSVGSYSLSVSNLTDRAGNPLDPDSEPFSYSAGPTVFFSELMNSDPGWSISGSEWAFGIPDWSNQDTYGLYGATSAHSGVNVYACRLTGDYANNIDGTYYLTTSAIDCSGYTNVTLGFQRWLSVERDVYDHANLQASSNGSTWVTVWENSSTTIDDPAWTNMTYDVSAIASRQETVHFRWGIGPTDSGWRYSGWAIDDVILTGSPMSGSGGSDGRVDNDGDGLPAWWEMLYYGGPTNASPVDFCANGFNTVRDAYIAGFNPLDSDAFFSLNSLTVHSPVILNWSGVSGRVYSVCWNSNLLNSFQTLETNLPWTPGIFTDTTHIAEEKGFYKIEVELE